MSVAAFHWITDHDLLFANLAAAMRPGARLTSDCGGQGQLAVMTAALVEVTGDGKFGTSFKGVDETRASLEGAGFDVEDVRLRPDPLRLEDPELLETYLATVNLGAHLADAAARGAPAVRARRAGGDGRAGHRLRAARDRRHPPLSRQPSAAETTSRASACTWARCSGPRNDSA